MAAHAAQRTSLGNVVFIFVSCFACFYVAGRLWITSRELQQVERENHRLSSLPRRASLESDFLTTATDQEVLRDGILHVSTRPNSGPGVKIQEEDITADLPLEVNPRVVGQIDILEKGIVRGWACHKGQLMKPLQVQIYVDGMKVGEASANRETPHYIVHRLCELDMRIAEDQRAHLQDGVGFELQLPDLAQGKHEVRAFAKNVEETAKQELNQSPLMFLESKDASSSEEALKRKDAIIRVRNAQIAALWQELHVKEPWRNALDTEAMVNLPHNHTVNASRALVVIGINSGIGVPDRRASLRKTWVPTGVLKEQFEDRGVYVRFIVGYSEQSLDPDEATIRSEAKQYGDILRLDTTDTYEDLPRKTLKMFAMLPNLIDADFYFKVDDDVAVNLYALERYLREKRTLSNLYMGCMKSGTVLTDQRYKWFEPEYWRFGDPSGEGGINYPRHAIGQIYGLSAPVARYIGQNAAILHKYANEDVSVGSWLVGLDVVHEDERRFCCDSDAKCNEQVSEGTLCLGYTEQQCAGICNSEQRLEDIWKRCLDNPLERKKQRAASTIA